MGHAENKREGIEKTELLLQSSHNGLSKSEIAVKLGRDRSTIHRWLEEIASRRNLLDMGSGRYRLDPSESLTSVHLHPSEALSIYLALRRIIRQTNKAPAFMISAIQKIMPALQRRDLIGNLNHAIVVLRQNRALNPEDTKIWETLIRGWLEGILVRIEYQKLGRDPIVHLCEPYLFEPMIGGDGTYVIVWSHLRDDLRTFKIDRIQRVTLTTQRFEPRELAIDDLIETAWGIHYGDRNIQIKLLFEAAVAERVLESVYHPSEKKTIQEDGSLLWTAELASTQEILPWIRGWSHHVKVLEPISLRDRIVQDLDMARNLYK